jgi:ADP-ribosylglycohydrolase
LLGGAIGDALGAPVEFMSLADIRRTHGLAGVTGYLPAYGLPGGAITDDTQMTLFTVEGLLRALVRDTHYGIVDMVGIVHRAYLRWLVTQGEAWPSAAEPAVATSWLTDEPGLHARRAPGVSSLSALATGRRGSVESPINHSKGCGAVMRSAPFGLIRDVTPSPFDLAVRCAVLTHGHPTGYLSAGFLAATVHELADGAGLDRALDEATEQLRARPDHGEVLRAVERAREEAGRPGDPSAERVEQLGAGWTGEEALAIGVYCALVAPDPLGGLLLAVNHSGDSDSTGSIAGNLIGVQVGEAGLPSGLLADLELREVITRLADDLVAGFHGGAAGSEHGEITPEIQAFLHRYPGA